MSCAECGSTKPHLIYDSENNLVAVHLIATNSVGSWRKELCYQCWTGFNGRTFTSIRREQDTFTATCAF